MWGVTKLKATGPPHLAVLVEDIEKLLAFVRELFAQSDHLRPFCASFCASKVIFSDLASKKRPVWTA